MNETCISFQAPLEGAAMADSISVLCMRAELARRIARELHNDTAGREMFQIAGELDAEADKMEVARK